MSYIVVLGAQRWKKLPTRTQRFLKQLHSTHQILYFQPSPFRFSGSPHRAEYKDACFHPMENVSVYTLPPVFALTNYDHPRLLQMDRKRIAGYIREKMRAHYFYHPLLWICSPVYVHLLDDLEYRGMVYDCFRYWGQYDIRWESLIANRADVLFAASPGLRDHLSPCNNNIAVIPDGGDVELFLKSEDLTLQAPAPLLRMRGPLLGFLGDVSRRMDLKPVYRAAKSHTAWHFVFVGRLNRANPTAELLEGLRNVHFLGAVNQMDLPRYAAHFNVLIDLLETDDPDEDVIPSRIYEYLTVGCPIAAMYPLRFSAVYPDVIYGARTEREFVEACERAVMENSGWATSARKQYALEATWNKRAKAAEEVLERNSLL